MLQRLSDSGDIQVVRLDAISAEAWDNVAVSRRTPMQEYIWVQAFAQSLGADEDVKVVAVGDVTAPAALAPLSYPSDRHARTCLLGAEELGEPVEVIYRDAAALTELAKGLADLSRPIGFGHYLRDTPFVDTLRDAMRGHGAVVVRDLPMRAAPFIVLDERWVEPEQTFTARRRSDFRRMRRKAEKFGDVRFEIISPELSEVDHLIDTCIDIEMRSWKGKSGTAMALNPIQNRFYRLYARAAVQAGILRLCFLHIGDDVAAMQIAVETNNRFWLLKIGYDDAFKGCSPGNLLLRETIRYAAERDLARYEFLGKEADWTRLWTEEAQAIVALRTYPYNLSGSRAMMADTAHTIRTRISKLRSTREAV